jgi:hypothetical protein
MKIVMNAKYTKWMKDATEQQKKRYPMMAAAHSASLINNGGVIPSDIYIISDIDNDKYINLLTSVGVNIINCRSGQYMDKFPQCIKVAKMHPKELICWLDADMFLFKKTDFCSSIERMIGDGEMLVGEGSNFNTSEKIRRCTEKWNDKDFFDTWGFSVTDLLSWSESTCQKWVLGAVTAAKAEMLINREDQLSINVNDELLTFIMSKLNKVARVPCSFCVEPHQMNDLVIKGVDSSEYFYNKDSKNPNSSMEDFYWVHYGGGYKLQEKTHVDIFLNNSIELYFGSI